MPRRIQPLITDEYYHVFNRTINKEPIFVNRRDTHRAIETINYYRFLSPRPRLSYFLNFAAELQERLISNYLNKGLRQVEIVAFVLMPNHFHFLLKQEKENGISKFLANFQNSYTKYFNTKNRRSGHLFGGQFKAVIIEDQEQLLHVNRYIHLNPFSSFVVKDLLALENYSYSSLPEYFGNTNTNICNSESILSSFPTSQAYKQFVFDQADYQRKLDQIKHLVFE